MVDVLPCPFCGKKPYRLTALERDRRVQCLTQDCLMYKKPALREVWNCRKGAVAIG